MQITTVTPSKTTKKPNEKQQNSNVSCGIPLTLHLVMPRMRLFDVISDGLQYKVISNI